MRNVEHRAQHVADAVARAHRHTGDQRRHREPGAELTVEPCVHVVGVGLDLRQAARQQREAVQLCLANDIRTPEAMDAVRDPNPVKPPTVAQISVPTTLSAGEFSHISGVTDERTKVKELFRHADIVTRAVVLDPAVTRHTPQWLWLSTGIRAVDHCVEGICSNEATPYGDASALHGLSLLARGLPKVKADPDDLAARLDCQLGSWLSMAPLVAGVPMGASHGIGYVLGAVFDIPHGHTSCIMLPSVMRWNKSANGPRQAMVAAAMGQPAMDAGDVLDAFIRGLDMPRSLHEVKVGREHFDRIARQAMGTPWVPRNPRPIFTSPRLRGMPSPRMKASRTSPASSPGWPIAAATSACRSALTLLFQRMTAGSMMHEVWPCGMSNTAPST